jgi:phosphomannomutase / phosphoglucomutase
MFPIPVPVLERDSFRYESTPLVNPTGFREYDARWLYGKEINLMGVQALGLGLGTLLHQMGVRPEIVTGHDYRSYSAAIKYALTTGLMAAGMRVHDIGLALSPMAYFAQFDLDVPAVAMVTASHNDNGWTGVKMGAQRPVTFGPAEMTSLKEIVLSGRFRCADGGGYNFVENFAARYIADLTGRKKIQRPLRVVAACGNGTAGAFAPDILSALGCDLIPMDETPDYQFPRYNPNPEDLKMLHAIAEKVRDSNADIGFGFDGDGDRCGVVDANGHEIFADKIGVMLARHLSRHVENAVFVVDVKSTGLFGSDPVLKARGVKTRYWKTGHSYIKRHVADLQALAGFEKSGHFFFNHPIGRGYDDGLLTAIQVLDMLDSNPGHSLADLYQALPKTWGSPTMSPTCADNAKYDVVDRITKHIAKVQANAEFFAGQPIAGVVTVNGVRVTCTDGTWGLVRASSNKPELVLVVESPVSEIRMREMFAAVDGLLRQFPEVGTYNQKI